MTELRKRLREGASLEVVTNANPLPVINEAEGPNYGGEETLTVGAAMVRLDPAEYGDATDALITVETAPMRVWFTGRVPTATTGHILNVGDTLTLDSGNQIRAAQFIRTAGTSGTVTASYGS